MGTHTIEFSPEQTNEYDNSSILKAAQPKYVIGGRQSLNILAQ
jgi:hypothetical protein